MRKAVFLDRDGVINRGVVRDGKPYAPTTLADFQLLPGAAEAMKALRAAGWLVIVATNQPDVATGKQSLATVNAMHQQLRDAGLVDDIKVCFHVDADHCACRKPKPGMLLEAAREHDIDLAASWMVGDRWRDIEAGQAAGCRTLFIDYGYAEKQPERPDGVVASLADVRDFIEKRAG
ncbi:MAG: HAD family hydrolase [Burkholderiales bacterium]|nr:HAD family hydrolase [Burkholderiales bacterium]